MGQVIPFIARIRDSGDWSESERAKLAELADRLTAAGVRVDVAYGTTDAGDPWCAVTDENGDVLIHVARIGGAFIVHSALDDSLNQGADLHSVLHDQLHAAAADLSAAPPSAQILPFEARRAQTILALVVAAAFFYETAGSTPAHAGEAALPTEAPHEPVAPPPDLSADDDARQVAIQGAAVSDEAHAASAAPALQPVVETAPIEPTPAAPAAPPEPEAAHGPAAAPLVLELADAPAAAPAAPPIEVHGTDGDDHIVGTAADEHILGGAGADTLESGGGHDTLDGGAGDDRIEVAAKVVSIGGSGADTFVIARPALFGHPDQLLGRIVDYVEGEGDRIINWRGDHIPLAPPHPDPAGPTPEGVDPASFASTPTTRVEVDLDGDGKIDGYLLVGHGAQPPTPPPEPPPPDGDHPITFVGQSSGWHDPGT